MVNCNMSSIFDFTKSSNPTIDSTAFPNTQSTFYWSSSTYAQNTNIAWSIYFLTGLVNVSGKTINNYVRCVTGS